ncbi:MAG TPA: hypothetical protein PKN48_11645 [Bacteroidales bacterium]|nr:hypothetical protein [Bacteroidales bacterium]
MKLKIVLLCFFIAIASISLLKAQGNASIKKYWYNPGKLDTLILSNMSFNSMMDDYAPMMFFDNKLYFTSDRRNRDGDKAELAFNEKIYVTKRTDTIWARPKTTYFFNTDDQTALAGISFSEEKLFVYKTFGNGDIYCSVRSKNKWTDPRKMKSPINSDGHEQSLTEENGILVLSSDRFSDDGTHDIIWSVKDQNGNYVNFLSLDQINTKGDEVDVRLDKAGKKLYYASNGAGGMGGYDIFYTTIDESGKWQKPVAMPRPINSESNDRYFFDCDSAFFLSSDRQGGKGGDDIYWGYIKREIPEIPKDTVIAEDTVIIENIVIVKDSVIAEVVKDTNRYVIMNQMLDSAGFKEYYARVQIGAYYNRTIEQFRKYYPSLKNRAIYIERVPTSNGKILNKFIIDQKFTTIKDAAVIQQEMWTVHKITDAFVAIYNMDNERIAIYNTIKGEFVILKGDQKPVYF